MDTKTSAETRTTTPETLLVSIPEAADQLGLSTRQLHRMLARRELRRVRLGGRSLIRRDDVLRLIDEHTEREP